MRLPKTLVAALLFFCVSLGEARAVDIILTPFTGPDVVSDDLQGVSSVTALPYLDGNGWTFNSTVPANIAPSIGLYLYDGNYTIAGFGPNVNSIGWNWLNLNTQTLTNVSFSNGESYSTPIVLPGTAGFLGFKTAAPFTSVTLTFNGGSATGTMSDFSTNIVTVPEPSTVITCILGALGLVAAGYRKRARRHAANS